MNWRNQKLRTLAYQGVLISVVLAITSWLIHNTLINMQARGIQTGFDFLSETAGFDIGESMVTFDSTQSYAKAFLVGMLNTLRVSVIGIFFSTLCGGFLGIGRLSNNALARGLCYVYTEVFRNIPLLLQLLMWYVVLIEWMPDSDSPIHISSWIVLSKDGCTISFTQHLSLMLSPEFLALTWGLTLYTSAFIAEVVRAGIRSVPKGQIEAAQSMGLSSWQSLRYVVLPQAMRLIVPPMANQYLNLIKNSSLAVAIGYPDLISVSNTSLNQTGRAVECITIVMVIYLAFSWFVSVWMNHYNRRIQLREG